MSVDDYNPIQKLNQQKFLLHHVLAAKKQDVDHISLRGTVALNQEDSWNFQVSADGALKSVGRFSAGEDEWVRVFVPYDVPYASVLGLHPSERYPALRDLLDSKNLIRGMDYEMFSVYPDKLKDATKIWMYGGKPTGFNLFLRKGAFQNMALEMLAELADYAGGGELAGWRGDEASYAKAFADAASAPATLVTNIINNADFQEHNLTRLANLAETKSMYELSGLLKKINGHGAGDKTHDQGGSQAMSF